MVYSRTKKYYNRKVLIIVKSIIFITIVSFTNIARMRHA